jgi:hypothetical protein
LGLDDNYHNHQKSNINYLKEKYKKQLGELIEIGFTDEPMNLKLLEINEGDRDAVVKEIIKGLVKS